MSSALSYSYSAYTYNTLFYYHISTIILSEDFRKFAIAISGSSEQASEIVSLANQRHFIIRNMAIRKTI